MSPLAELEHRTWYLVCGGGGAPYSAERRSPWNEYWIERGRQELFRLRDEVFSIAARRGELDFESESYKVIRGYFNGLIRFAYIINVLTLLFVVIKDADLALSRGAVEVEKAVASLEPDEIRCEFP